MVGGTPSFLVHRTNDRFVCSPGTFVFFDIGYSKLFPENTFQMAVQIISRVISKPTNSTICIDLGHKSVAAENPIENRVRLDVFYIENNVLAPTSHISERILAYHCKVRAIEDLLFALREKEMPLQDMLKLIRRLSKKQFKLKYKVKRLLLHVI